MVASAAYPVAPIRYRAFDNNGAPLIGGKFYAYEAGSTTTPKPTYSDKTLENLNTWPVIFDDAGSAAIFISGDYYCQIYDANDVLIEESDGNVDPETVALMVVEASSGGTGNLESRVSDLESANDDKTDQINELIDDVADLDTRLTAEVTTDRNAAITTAVNAAKAEFQTKLDDLEEEFDAKLDAQKIKIGDIYETLRSGNPGDVGNLGYGTWTLWGQGRATVGFSNNVSDPDWTQTIENTFGAYTEQLDDFELPEIDFTYQKFTGETFGDVAVKTVDGNGLMRYADNTTVTTGGDATPFNIVQPSIVVYRWKRTA